MIPWFYWTQRAKSHCKMEEIWEALITGRAFLAARTEYFLKLQNRPTQRSGGILDHSCPKLFQINNVLGMSGVNRSLEVVRELFSSRRGVISSQ